MLTSGDDDGESVDLPSAWNREIPEPPAVAQPAATVPRITLVPRGRLGSAQRNCGQFRYTKKAAPVSRRRFAN